MLRLLCSTLLLAALSLSAAETPPALAGLTYSGDQSALEALDRDLVAAGTDAGKLAALETRLLAMLRRTDTTFTARQAICQRLGTVLAVSAAKTDATALKPLATMLLDERDSDLARLALESAPGAAIDTLFTNALGRTSGRTRLGVIESLARRRQAAAVPALAQLLANPDTAIAHAAARALGQIGTTEADSALRTAPGLPAPLVAAARLEATTHLPATDAERVLRELQDNRQLPASIRTAAFRRSLGKPVRGTGARLIAALDGSDWNLKQVALEALAPPLPSDLVSLLVGKLATWDAPTQTGVIAALARSGDAAAVPAVVAATRHASPEVRTEALSALGFLPGSRDTTALLARAAAADTPDAKVARQSLTRHHGPDVSAAILAGAERGEPALRVVYLDQLALRHMTEALPILFKCRQESDATVRAAAVGAFGELAPFSEQKAALDWAIAATDDTEQTRALRALVNITLRNGAAAERGRAIYAALDSAKPEVALRLLPALPRLGGSASAECAAALAARNDSKLAAAAVDALARWTDATALPALATVAEKAAVGTARDSARSAALRYFERNRDEWTPETTTIVARLLASTKDAAPRRELLGVLARANDAAALTLANSFQADAALAGDARYAAAAITAARAGAPVARASKMAGVSNLFDGKTTNRWSAPTLGEEWIEVDFRVNRPLRRLTLDQAGRTGEYPEHYTVHITDDAKNPGPAVVQGKGQRNKTVIELPAGSQGRYVVIKNDAERAESSWTVSELYVD